MRSQVRPSIAMVAPARRQCGIADYTRYLLPELRKHVDVPYAVEAGDFTRDMNSVDLVHVQHQYFLFGGVAPWRNRFERFASRLRVPAVMTVHEFVVPRGNPLVRAAIAVTNRMHFRHRAVKRLIVHTEADRARMAAAGIPADRIVVVRHGVPLAPVVPQTTRETQETVVAALDGLRDRFVITLFGFLSRRKGHLLALQAIERLPEDVTLIFAGGKHPDDRTGYVDAVTSMIHQHGLDDRVQITGFLDDMEVAGVMQRSDLIVAPFVESSGSGSLALALAYGKPILASDIPPHAEIVRDTPGAIVLFPSGSAPDFERYLLALREDPARRAALAEGARRYAAAHSYARMAEETVQVYHQVLSERAPCG